MEIYPDYYLIEWIMTIFSKSLSIEIATRIWDIFVYEGITAIFSAAIVFLSHYEGKFLKMEYEDILKEIKIY